MTGAKARGPETHRTQFAALLALLRRDAWLSICRKGSDGKLRASVVRPQDGLVLVERHRGAADLWFGLNDVTGNVARGKRGGVRDVRRVVGLMADLDVKADGLGSITACEAVIGGLTEELGRQPVAIIHSGHGLQPIWALAAEDPETSWSSSEDPRFAAAKELYEKWGRLVHSVAAEVGGQVDDVFDLARIMRVPGTVNRKEPAAPVPTSVQFARDAQFLTVAEAFGRVEGAVGRRGAGAVTAADQPMTCLRPGRPAPRGTASTTLDQAATELGDTRHERNNTLNRRAFGLAVAGAHEKREARSALLEAAQDAGLDAAEADRTFESGWRAGVRARHGQREPTEGLARMTRNALRDRVWDSGLCGKHKLLLLAILKHMNNEDRAWPSVATLAGHCSMSRSTVTELLRDLAVSGWIEKGAAHWLTTPGRRPNGYQPPLLAAQQFVPDHCVRVRGRIANLHRGPNLQASVKSRPSSGRRVDWQAQVPASPVPLPPG